MTELFAENQKITPEIAASILRNKDGLNNLPLGFGNEKALNQLIAHHAVIFKPEKRLVWVSSNPYQLGEMVCYDLNKVFENRNNNDSIVSLQQEKLNITQDPFVKSMGYKNYESFRIEDHLMDAFLKDKKELPFEFAKNYQSLNPDYWGVYYKIGLYFYKKNDYQQAQLHFEKALTKEITTLPEKQKIEMYLKKIKRKAS